MEIGQFRVVLRAKNFERTSHFYAKVLALPRLMSWDGESGSGALFQAGSGVIEIRGLPSGAPAGEPHEAFTYHGPMHKMTLTLQVESAERAYEELIFREQNIAGGLSHDAAGHLMFETNDPDGVKIQFRELG
jgi:catechol 2,3-dioxygenase-like lactoylglutathione lyase family enzyme